MTGKPLIVCNGSHSTIRSRQSRKGGRGFRFRIRRPMAEIDVVLSILGSASALYGFTIAYHGFTRGLQDQERARQWQTYREWHLRSTEGEAKVGIRKSRVAAGGP